jgi:hypothetical protein
MHFFVVLLACKSVDRSTFIPCSDPLYLQLFVGRLMSYLRYLCLFAIVVSNIYCLLLLLWLRKTINVLMFTFRRMQKHHYRILQGCTHSQCAPWFLSTQNKINRNHVFILEFGVRKSFVYRTCVFIKYFESDILEKS